MRVATLELTIDASGAVSGAVQYEQATRRAGDAAAQAADTNRDLTSALGGVRTAFAALAGATAVRELVNLVDTATLVDARLRLVTDSTAELTVVQGELRAIAQRTGQSLEASAQLFTQLRRTADAYGATSADVLQVVEAVASGILVSGSSAQAAEAAIIQLTQGLAAGVLRGQEFNSVFEQTPRVAEAIAAGLGIPITQLRALANEGELTAERVVRALQSQLPTLQAEAAQIPLTFGRALTDLRNAAVEFAATFEETTGAVSGLARAVVGLATLLRENAGAVAVLAGAAGLGALVKAAAAARTALAGVAAVQTVTATLQLAAGVRSLRDVYVVATLAARTFWTAATGPIGLAVAGLAAVAAGVNAITKRKREAAAAEREFAQELTQSTRAQLDRLVAELESQRVAVRAQLDDLGTNPNGFRQRALERDLANINARLSQAVAQLQQVRSAAANVAPASTLSELDVEVANLNGQLEAFRRGGERAAEAFARAATDWDLAANSGRTLAQALAANDPAARAAVAGARRLVDAQAALKAAQDEAKEALDRGRKAREQATRDAEDAAERLRKADEKARAAADAYARTQAEAEAAIAQTREERLLAIETAEREFAALQLGEAAVRALAVELAGEAAVRQAVAQAQAAGIVLSQDAQNEIAAEAERLAELGQQADALRAKLSARSFDGVGRIAQGFADVANALAGATTALGTFGDVVETVLSRVGQLAQGVNRIQRAGIFEGAGGKQQNVGFLGALRGDAGAAGVAAALGGVGAVVAALGPLADALGRFLNRAEERRRELQRRADEFNAALDAFAANLETNDTARAIRQITEETTGALANLLANFQGLGLGDLNVDRVLSEQFREGLRAAIAGVQAEIDAIDGNPPANVVARLQSLTQLEGAIGDVLDILGQRLAALAPDILSDLEGTFLRATGQGDLADLNDAAATLAETQETLAALFNAGAIDAETYARALEQAGAIYQSEVDRIAQAAQAAERAATEAAAKLADAIASADVELNIRQLRLSGDALGATIAELTAQAEKEIAARRAAFAAGELTAEQLADFEMLIGDELAAAIRDASEAAKEAAAAERERADAAARAEAERLASSLGQIEERRLSTLAQLDDATGRAAAEELRLVQRTRQRAEASTDAERAALEELFAVEDAIRATLALADARERERAAAEALAGITGDLQVQLLRETGDALGAALLELERDIARQRQAILDAGGGQAELDLLAQVEAARRRNLQASAAQASASASASAARIAEDAGGRAAAPIAAARGGATLSDVGRLVGLQGQTVALLQSIDRRLATLTGTDRVARATIAAADRGTPTPPGDTANVVDRILAAQAVADAQAAGRTPTVTGVRL